MFKIEIFEDITPRNLIILKTRSSNPKASSRELSEILERKYGISLSHNRVNEILRELKEKGVFRENIIFHEDFFNYYHLKIAFNYSNYGDKWEDCYNDLMEDPHIHAFFNADSAFPWQCIALFRSQEKFQEWTHEFFKEHGDLINKFDATTLHKLHKFGNDSDILDEIISESKEGENYLKFNKDKEGSLEEKEQKSNR